MTNSTLDFGHLYHPVKTLVIFKRDTSEADYYVESYDMDREGKPIGGHPLSVQEGHALAKALTVHERKAQRFLMPTGLMPPNLLHFNTGTDGFALWHTPAQPRELLFLPSLGISCGTAGVPTLLWKAHKGSLQVFALPEGEPALNTQLYKAPFFNIYPDGRVCMGNVRMSFPRHCGLEDFIRLWEYHFFHSYFSHTIHGESPVKGNLIQLWQHLRDSGEPFPQDQLIDTKVQLKDLL